MAEKCHPYTGIGLRGPRATRIAAGMYACHRVLSLAPAFEVFVCKWRGAPCTHFTFMKMAPGPVCVTGPTERVRG